MIPDLFTRGQLVREHQHTLQCEAEGERMLADVPKHSFLWLQRHAGRLGMFLIVFGTRLKQYEPCREAVVHETRSG